MKLRLQKRRGGKVGEVCNLARQGGRKWRGGAEQKSELHLQRCHRLASLARTRLQTSPTFARPLAHNATLFREMVSVVSHDVQQDDDALIESVEERHRLIAHRR